MGSSNKTDRVKIKFGLFIKFIFVSLVGLSFLLSFSCKEKKLEEEAVENPILKTKSPSDTLRVVNFSADPPAISPYHAFDPDSYSAMSAMYDGLIYIDSEGNIKPALATKWRLINPTTLRLELRKGVRFHNGEGFNAKSVKFTIDTHLDKKVKSPTGQILSSIKEVKIINNYTVDIITHFPDGMLLNRFAMFGNITPPEYIKKVGLDEFAKHPIGTGPFKFVKWERGVEIAFERNKDYWYKNRPAIEKLTFVIIPESTWYMALLNGNVDFVMHMSGKYAEKIERDPETRIVKRLVISSYWVVLKNEGPLADFKVRKALNHAIDKQKLIRHADYGNGEVMSSMGKKGEFGYNPDIKAYEHNVKKAKALLKEAGYQQGFNIKVLVSDISRRIADLIKEDFSQIGVTLEIQEVSRPEWSKRIPMAKMTKGKIGFDGDMAISLVDNPIMNMAFHAFIFLHSNGVFSLSHYPEYEKKLMWALSISNRKEHEKRLKVLDKYIHDNALFIPTYQRILTVAMRKNVKFKRVNINGHLDFDMVSTMGKE